MPANQEAGRVGSLLAAWQTDWEEKAFEALCRAASPIIREAAGKVLGDHGATSCELIDQAESLVLLHLWRLREKSRAKFDPQKSGRAYLTWLSRNRARDVLRRQRTYAPLPPDFDVPDRTEEVDWRALSLAIKKLDQRKQSVIVWLLEGISPKQIANRLGVHVGTVSRTKQKAIKELQELIKDADDWRPRHPR